MSELHIIGEIESGHDFGGSAYFCTYEIVTGTQWTVIEGRTSGSTHVMRSGPEGIAWNFPIDVHYSFNSVQGWPKIAIQVWQLDDYGCKDIGGYGTAYLPMPSGGPQEMKLSTWRPSLWSPSALARLWETMRLFLMGGYPVLRDNSLIADNEQRFKLHTITSGTVRMTFTVFGRGMRQAGLIYS
jgi:B9 domain-containing protein 2